MEYQGKSVVEGIALGTVQYIQDSFDEILQEYVIEDQEHEKLKYVQALSEAAKQLRVIVTNAKEANNKEQIEIMEAHLFMLQDPMLDDSINLQIEAGESAPKAIIKASDELANMLENLEDAYLRERAADVKDVGKRLLRRILNIEEPKIDQEGIILCGEDIEPSLIANLSSDQVSGIVMGSGSSTSHAVIIAKAKGLVTIVGLGTAMKDLKNGSMAIIDGYKGKFIVEPSIEIMNEYQKKAELEKQRKAYYLSLADLPGITKDGYKVTLATNIGNPKDIDDALKYGCQGVGLYRTEFIFMGKKQLPTEDEQYKAYRYVVEKANGQLCVIRTMDIGGDKPLEYLSIGKEENPFLGWRAIRICLERTDIFMTQIKAILRASAYGKVAIMLPMIINLEEIKQAKVLIERAKLELTEAAVAFAEDVQVGIMIETPAAAVMASVFAKEVDFFSIGTNDLVQYTLAVDRGNQKVSYLYDHFNIAVIHLITKIVEAAHANGKWVGVCGEMASDPLAVVLFMEMAIDELSMSAPSIPKIKEVIRGCRRDGKVLEQVLKLTEAAKIREFLSTCIVSGKAAEV
ncbi:MAG: phosphoenolpyruvate--protein phosphotransferase [Firmicutes bacterium HGW-Firmicutes-1]|jgi:phosphotransferase system enzyme I (PtsI)|nr:MAG: phosphoenolpyruvate--protein phosphotransferase [Firmicutes bacterium HGW-Firmicutes-1]